MTAGRELLVAGAPVAPGVHGERGAAGPRCRLTIEVPHKGFRHSRPVKVSGIAAWVVNVQRVVTATQESEAHILIPPAPLPACLAPRHTEHRGHRLVFRLCGENPRNDDAVAAYGHTDTPDNTGVASDQEPQKSIHRTPDHPLTTRDQRCQ